MGMFLIQAIVARRELVKPLPRNHTRYSDRDTQSSIPGSATGPSVKLMGAAKMRMNVVLDLGSGELTFQKKASRVSGTGTDTSVSAVILVMGTDKRFAKPAISF